MDPVATINYHLSSEIILAEPVIEQACSCAQVLYAPTEPHELGKTRVKGSNIIV